MIKTEKRKIYWYFLYPVAAAAFIVVSAIFILSAKGCKISIDDNGLGIERMGMIIVNSRPTGATILLNGKDIKKKTSQFFSTNLDKQKRGSYTLRVEKEGFYSWERKIEVLPEMVTWANYVLLFSKNPKIEKTDFGGSIVDSISSEDKKNSALLFSEKGEAIIYLFNNINGERTAIFENSKVAPESKLVDIGFVEFSRDKKNLLLSAILKGERRFFVLNTETKTLEDFNALFPVKFSDAHFNVQDSSELFVVKEKEIFKVNIRNKTVSSVLENNVAYFTQVEGKIYYIKDNSGSRSLWQASSDMSGRTNLFDAMPLSEEYEIKVSSYDKKIAILAKTGGMLYILDMIKNDYALSSIGEDISDFSWTVDGERMFYKGKDVIYVLDVKDNKTFEISGAPLFKNLVWYDNRHLISQKDGKAIIMDFDGINTTVFGGMLEKTKVFFSGDDKNIYFFSPNEIPEKTTLSIYKTEL